jgi:hypothetical protein
MMTRSVYSMAFNSRCLCIVYGLALTRSLDFFKHSPTIGEEEARGRCIALTEC